MKFRFNYRSQALGEYTDVTVVIPTDGFSYYDVSQGAREHVGHGAPRRMPVYHPGIKFQTVYLIHGGGDDDTLPFRYTNVERYAEDNCVMLVCPDIANSFGLDTSYGKKYSTFLCEELPVLIRSYFPSSPERKDNFIVGYAMGGNAALGNALLHPENYSFCVDLSGGIGFTPRTQMLKDELESEHFSHFPVFTNSFGPADALEGSDHDLAAVIRRGQAEGVEFPKLYIACGSREFIRARVEGDVAALREMGVELEYELAEGYDHNFDMWDVYLRKAFSQILPLKRSKLEM